MTAVVPLPEAVTDELRPVRSAEPELAAADALMLRSLRFGARSRSGGHRHQREEQEGAFHATNV